MENLLVELDRVVDASGLRVPLVFVGHSFGGYLLRHYAAFRPGKVAALVLVDPMDPDEWSPSTPGSAHKLSRGVMMSRWGARLAGIGVVRLALDSLMAGSRTLPKLIARGVSTGRGAAFTEQLVGQVRKLPPEIWPMVKAHWCEPKNFRGMARYLEVLSRNSTFLPDGAALHDVPLWVISGGHVSEPTLEAHRALARQSRRGVHLVARNERALGASGRTGTRAAHHPRGVGVSARPDAAVAAPHCYSEGSGLSPGRSCLFRDRAH